MQIKSFRTFLNEALIDVDASDVNKIYAPLKDVIKELTVVWNRNFDRLLSASTENKKVVARTISRELNEVIRNYQPIIKDPIKVIDSSSLKSETAKKAHAVNPIKIHVWLISPPNAGNFYHPSSKSIHISLPYSVADAMLNRLAYIPNDQLPNLKNEVSEFKFKTTIRHELTHWIDDSIHNFYITKSLNNFDALKGAGKTKEAQLAYKNDILHHEVDIYLSPIEINAMVNQIAEYKRRVGVRKYDSLSWKQLMVDLPTLSSLNNKFGSYWRKKMFERLSREGLIGKNFQKEF